MLEREEDKSQARGACACREQGAEVSKVHVGAGVSKVHVGLRENKGQARSACSE